MFGSKVFLTLCTALTSLTASATLQFTTNNVAVPRGARWVTTGDFNQDGHTDFAIADSLAVDVYLNNGNGTYALSGTYQPLAARQVETADINRDGKLDLDRGQ